MTVIRSIDGVCGDMGRDCRPDLRRITGGRLAVATLMACSFAATGCQSGMSMTKPSWWKFGGSAGGGDAAKLAAAPTFSSDAKKPSETNSPYPTTSTPNGYVVTGSNAAGSGPATQVATSIGPVVYGSAPPASTAAPAAQPQVGATAQTGPYATLAGETIPPPGQPLPPIAPLSNPVAPPAAASLGPQASSPAFASQTATPPVAGPAYRTADASAATGYSNFSSAAGGEPPAAAGLPAGAAPGGMPATGMPPGGGAMTGMTSAGMTSAAMADGAAAAVGGRYGAQSASRFSAGGATPAAPAAYGQPPADAAFPPPDAALPAGAQPAAAPLAPPAAPGLLPQPTMQQPVRRPDPGYRPFDTGSYRPSSTILAHEPGAVPTPATGAVRPVSFEQAAAGPLTGP